MIVNHHWLQQQAVGPFHLFLSALILILTLFPHLFHGHNKYGSVSAYYTANDINLKHIAIEQFDILNVDDFVWTKSISTREIKLDQTNDSNASKLAINHNQEQTKRLHFYSKGRNFELLLNKPRHLVTTDLSIVALDADNRKTKIYYDSNNLQVLNGFLAEDPNSKVTASLDKRKKLITAHIKTPKDTIIIEPTYLHEGSLTTSFNHSDTKEQPVLVSNNRLYNETMIVYSLSDHKKFKFDPFDNSSLHYNHNDFDFDTLCPYIHVNESQYTSQETPQTIIHPSKTQLSKDDVNLNYKLLKSEDDYKQARAKRSIDHGLKDKSRCTLHIVADYLFYKHVGNGDMQTTINYILALVNRVNQIYLPTRWEANDDWSVTNIGFTIQNITIHQNYTRQTTSDMHYNVRADRVWTAREFLENFSRNSPANSFCLAHLLTYRQFDAPVLGLAYVASPRPSTIGGICSPVQWRGDVPYKHNTGISTSQGFGGETLITRQADLVVAHEFGHNFGAEHDSNECRPQKDGAYLMHPYAVMGFEKNNRFMSNCSLVSIGRVIKNKRSCFVAVVDHLCGNGVVEDDEECDGGGLGYTQDDPCCDSNCRFTPGSQCSDRHSWCCNKCRITPAGVLCRPAEPDNCKQAGYCDGRSPNCTESAQPVDDGQVCVGRGLCKSGTCTPFCEARNLTSCLCNVPKDACKLCCKSDETCRPYDQKAPYLPDGVLCYRGVCERGRCEQPIQDVVERLWDVIEDINFRTIVKFLRDNIILVVLLVSIPIWMIIAHYIDQFDNRIKHDVYNAIISSKNKRKASMSPFLPRLFFGDEPSDSPASPAKKDPRNSRQKASSSLERIGFKAPEYGFVLPAGEEVVYEPTGSIPMNKVRYPPPHSFRRDQNEDTTNQGDTNGPYSTQV